MNRLISGIQRRVYQCDTLFFDFIFFQQMFTEMSQVISILLEENYSKITQTDREGEK